MAFFQEKKRKSTMLTNMSLMVKKLSPNGQLPVRGSPGAAGYDLFRYIYISNSRSNTFSAQSVVIPAKGKVIVPTDISIALPAGTYGRVAPRSGLAVKHFLDVGAGVVDCDYRGPLVVVMFNFSDVDFQGAFYISHSHLYSI